MTSALKHLKTRPRMEQVSVSLPRALLRRIKKIGEAYSGRLPGARYARGRMLRAAIVVGVEAIERELELEKLGGEKQ